TDGGKAIGVRTGSRNEPVALLELRLEGAEIELPPRFQLAPERLHALRIAAHQVEHEALEVRRLGDVHGGAGRGVSLCRRAWSVHPRAEELFKNVVFVGGQHQPAHGQPHFTGDVPGKNVAKIARRLAEVLVRAADGW